MAIKRDDPISFKIPGDEPMLFSLPIDDHLLVFTKNKIWKVISPEGSDPDMKHPDAPWTISEFCNHGASTPIVARTVLQAKELLDSVLIQSDIDKKLAIEIMLESMELLLCCYEKFSRVYDISVQIINEFSKKLEEIKTSRVISDVKQIPNLGEEVGSFLLNGKRFLSKLINIFDVFFQQNFDGPYYHLAIPWAETTFGPENELTKLLISDQAWIVNIIEMRNAFEHPRDDFKLEISNFTISPERKINVPTWNFIKNSSSDQEPKILIEDMGVYTQNLLEFSEELFLLSLKNSIRGNFPYLFYKIEEEKRNPETPFRFRVTIDRDKIRNESG